MRHAIRLAIPRGAETELAGIYGALGTEVALPTGQPKQAHNYVARVLVTLIYEMIRRDVHRGIAALCLGGGNAVAMAVER